MAESLIVYAGIGRFGKQRKAALRREAARRGRNVSVADVIWEALTKGPSPQLKADLLLLETQHVQ